MNTHDQMHRMYWSNIAAAVGFYVLIGNFSVHYFGLTPSAFPFAGLALIMFMAWVLAVVTGIVLLLLSCRKKYSSPRADYNLIVLVFVAIGFAACAAAYNFVDMRLSIDQGSRYAAAYLGAFGLIRQKMLADENWPLDVFRSNHH